MPEFDVYEKVWVMEYNKPKEKLVYSIVHEMNFSKIGIDTYYHLTNSKIGAGLGNNGEDRKWKESEIFPTKSTLIGSL